MLFESQIALYNDADSPIAKKFQTQDTRFEVIQGEINALISETELRTLIDGGQTMYTKLNNISMDVNGITSEISSMQTDIDGNSGAITSINSTLVTYGNTIDGLSASITATRSDLNTTTTRVNTLSSNLDGFSSSLQTLTDNVNDNYYTKSEIEQRENSITSTVSETYATKTQAQSYANTAQTNAINTASADATSKANAAQSAAVSIAATDAQNKADTAQANAIRSANNYTDTELEDYVSNDALSTTLTNYSTITQTSEAITTAVSSKVGESEVISLIEQQADSIRLKADKIAWDSTYSSMTEGGELTCRRINIASESQSGYTLTLNAGQLNSQSADKLRYTVYWAGGQSIYQRDTINDEWVYTGFFGTAAGGSGPVFDTSSKDQVLRNQMSPTGFTYYSRASVSDSWHPIFKVSTYNNADGDATVQIGRSDNHQYMSLSSSSFALYRTDGTAIASLGTSSSSFSIESYDSLKSVVLTPTYLSFRKRNSKNDAWTEVKRYS